MNKTEEEITVEEFLNLESKRQINRMVRTQSSACSESERGEGEGRGGKGREGKGREGEGGSWRDYVGVLTSDVLFCCYKSAMSVG